MARRAPHPWKPHDHDLLEHLFGELASVEIRLEELYRSRRRLPDNDPLREDIAKLERIKATQAAMIRVVGHVGLALHSSGHYCDDVAYLDEQLAKRRRRRWVTYVRETLGRPARVSSLPTLLASLDELASKLTPELVERRFSEYGQRKNGRTPIATIAGLAARLAMDCGAFGFPSFLRAKTAFDKALRQRKSEYS